MSIWMGKSMGWVDMKPCLESLIELYWKEKSEARKKSPLYQKDHIFDEEKSVKWNREEVIKVNALIDTDNKAKQEEHLKNAKEIYEQILFKIMEENKVNRKVAEIIYGKAEADGDSEGAYYVSCRVDDYIDLYEEFMQANKEN